MGGQRERGGWRLAAGAEMAPRRAGGTGERDIRGTGEKVTVRVRSVELELKTNAIKVR